MTTRDLPPTDLLLVGKAAYLDRQDEAKRRDTFTLLERWNMPELDAPWTAVIRALLVDYDITPKVDAIQALSSSDPEGGTGE